MLNNACETLIYDMFPDLQDVLRPELDAVRSRGVRVAGIAYRAEDVQPSVPFEGKSAGQLRMRWPGVGLIPVRDACEQLVARISFDMTQIFNAVYSDSPLLSCIMHGLLQADIRLAALWTENGGTLPASPPDAFALQAARLLPPAAVHAVGG